MVASERERERERVEWQDGSRMAGKSCWLAASATAFRASRSAGTEAAQVTCKHHPRVPVHYCAPVVNGAVECFEKFILTRPSTRKQYYCASTRPIGSSSYHTFRHNCNLSLLLRALHLHTPTISLEHSPCNGRAAVQQTPTMLLQPSTPSLDASPPHVT